MASFIFLGRKASADLPKHLDSSIGVEWKLILMQLFYYSTAGIFIMIEEIFNHNL